MIELIGFLAIGLFFATIIYCAIDAIRKLER